MRTGKALATFSFLFGLGLFGPMEWLRRSLTHGGVQPMRLAPAAVPATEVVPG